jgi:hypothetical protein
MNIGSTYSGGGGGGGGGPISGGKNSCWNDDENVSNDGDEQRRVGNDNNTPLPQQALRDYIALSYSSDFNSSSSTSSSSSSLPSSSSSSSSSPLLSLNPQNFFIPPSVIPLCSLNSIITTFLSLLKQNRPNDRVFIPLLSTLQFVLSETQLNWKYVKDNKLDENENSFVMHMLYRDNNNESFSSSSSSLSSSSPHVLQNTLLSITQFLCKCLFKPDARTSHIPPTADNNKKTEKMSLSSTNGREWNNNIKRVTSIVHMFVFLLSIFYYCYYYC